MIEQNMLLIGNSKVWNVRVLSLYSKGTGTARELLPQPTGGCHPDPLRQGLPCNGARAIWMCSHLCVTIRVTEKRGTTHVAEQQMVSIVFQ